MAVGANRHDRAGLVEGKVALVTGAASGIGRATALALARDGARVLVADRDGAGAQAVVKAIAEQGGEARATQTDVSQPEQVEAMVRAAVDAFGRLDCAVNGAGILATPALLHELALDQWERTLAVNLTGVFLCMQHELRVMREQGAGSIVNVASGGGVRVNAICPGSTDTPMLQGFMGSSPEARKMILASAPPGRLGTAEEVAEAAVWLCSDRASYVSGESLFVDYAAVSR